jgi:hypothetical protein
METIRALHRTQLLNHSFVNGFYPNLSQYAEICAQTVQSEPSGVVSSQQLTGEPERNHPFAKPFWGPNNSNEGSNPSLSAIS